MGREGRRLPPFHELLLSPLEINCHPVNFKIVNKQFDNFEREREKFFQCLREIHGAVDEADPSSSGILEDYTQRLEQQSWFLSAQNYSA